MATESDVLTTVDWLGTASVSIGVISGLQNETDRQTDRESKHRKACAHVRCKSTRSNTWFELKKKDDDARKRQTTMATAFLFSLLGIMYLMIGTYGMYISTYIDTIGTELEFGILPQLLLTSRKTR